ncbi:MAG: hypothetical protein [Inoviridae sp.]|nr:MAG: hypothetical protein [Inoviridae sp.]
MYINPIRKIKNTDGVFLYNLHCANRYPYIINKLKISLKSVYINQKECIMNTVDNNQRGFKNGNSIRL